MCASLGPPDERPSLLQVDIQSSWKRGHQGVDANVQTEGMAVKNQASQAKKRADMECQADDAELQLHSAFQSGAIDQSLVHFMEK